MVNVIPPDHVDDVPVVEPNRHDDVPVIPEPILVDEDEDPKDEEFEEEEPQEEEDDMEVDIEEDDNEPELAYPYKEVDPLNPLLPASESEPEDVIEVEDTVESEDETVPASVYEVGTSTLFLVGWLLFQDDCVVTRRRMHWSKKGKAMDDYYVKLILNLGNEVRSSVEEGTTVMQNLIKKLGNAKETAECKRLKKELEEARFSNTLLRMQNERVERDLYWTRVRAHEFYREMIRRGFVFEERPNEAIDVLIVFKERPRTDSIESASDCVGKKSLSYEPRESPHDAYFMPLKSAPLTQAAIRRMIKESVDAAIAAERCNPTVFCGTEGAVELRRWFKKTESIFGISECVESKKVKFVAAILQGLALTWWNSKIATMGLETINQMPWTKMKQLMTVEFCLIEKIQRMKHELWNLKVKEYNIVSYTLSFNELALMCPRMVKPESVKVDAYIRGLSKNIKGEVTSSRPTNPNEAVRMAHKLMEQKSQARDERILDGKKQKWENFQSGNSSGNARAMTTASTEKKESSGSLPVCERCFTHHVGPCTIKYHKCGKVGHKSRYCKEKSVVTGTNTQTGSNVVTGMFLLNNRYASVLFDSGSDRSFMDTRFSSMLNIEPIKISASYEVELADGRTVSTNTVLKGCTLNLVNHLFEIDIMPIEHGTFDVIIGMDGLVKHGVVIICGEKVVRIPYGNKMLTVESDKGKSRLKVISCIKARKYVERGCHLFLAHVTENKLKEKRLEDVHVIRAFPEVFPDDLLGLSLPRQVEF
ncbi:reverse transcriptase domain-containing protein [Tanacetum coccineum]